MEKEIYYDLEMEIVYFDCEDVITTSGGNEDYSEYEDGGDVYDL